ncbi:unnamed protein product [Ectocarpus sp. CCAP 1310/34]|nr:unnamed protein product [Ectocarpus sp. CCAP 1310/34]
MAVDFPKSQKAHMLPINLSEDFMFALRKFCGTYGNKTMTQPALKMLQSIPLVHSALAVKEADKMSAAQRNLAASKCMQEIAVPGFIKLIEHALSTMGGPLQMPHKWKVMVYYTTLGSGVYLMWLHQFVTRTNDSCCVVLVV